MPSSVISKILYNDETSTLRIIFLSGVVYDYKNVPFEVYTDMKNASSKGTYLNKNIKGHYSFKKVSK